MLSNYDAHGGYSYRHSERKLWMVFEFFQLAIVIDPEDTLKLYFGWEPQEP